MAAKNELLNLLKENQILDQFFFTHVSLIQPKGKFSLSRSALTNFWDLYCKSIKNDEKLGIAEMPVDSINSIVVDVDLKFNTKSQDVNKLYTDKFVDALIQIYQDVLQEVIEKCDENNSICVLLEKQAYTVQDIVKNGFHLHFPYLFLSRVDQEIVIIPRVRKLMLENKYGIKDEFNQFSSFLVNPCLEQLIDTQALKNAWLLYGSRKHEEQDTYLISKIVKNKGEELTLFDAFKDYKLFNEEEEIIELSRIESIEFNLPRILSICPYGRTIFELKKSISNHKDTLENYKNFTRKVSQRTGLFELDKKTDEEITADLQVVKELLPFFGVERADNRNDWMTVGWAIFNISQGNDEGLELWIDFSRKSYKFNEPKCIYEWSHMEDRKKVTLGTLKYFAKKDSPDAYQKYLVEQGKKGMIAFKTSHYDMAMLLHKFFGNDFVYAESGWYRFVNHHWEFIDSGTELRSKISNELVTFFREYEDSLSAQRIGNPDEQQRTKLKEMEDTVRKIACSLKSTPYKNNVIRECQEIFHIRDFEKKLNTNRYLIGFQNGVFDLEENVFRDGLPTDYISVQMPISYRDYTMDDPLVKNVLEFFEKVFPDRSLRRYFLDIMSECFVGYNHRKQVWFLTGDGDNGKSITSMIFEKMFGRLSIKAPSSLITSKRPSAGSANAELARTGSGTRIIWLEEIDQDEEIVSGVFKHLSGNDSFYTRDLYQSGKNVTEIVPMFRLFVICNKLPKIRKGGDKATWNRIRVIPFEATFAKNPPKTPEEQLQRKTFPVDTTLAQKIPDMIEPLCWFLLQHRLKSRIDDPEKVIAATDNYKAKNDYLHMFANQCVVEEPNAVLDSNQFYQSYKDWLQDNISGLKPIPYFDFVEYYEKKYGALDENYCWSGKRFCYERAGGAKSLSRDSLSSLL